MGFITNAAQTQRGDLGTLDDFGSNVKSSNGWTLMTWMKTTQQNSGGLMLTFSQNSATGNAQSLWWMVNTGYTSTPVNSANSILINLGDQNDAGFLYHQVVSDPDLNDGNWHHHAITVKVGNPHEVICYVDAQSFTNWTKPFDDQLPGSVVNYTSTVPMGNRKIFGPSYTDFLSAEYEDARIYKVALTAKEISEIYWQRGRDNIKRNILRRWPLFTNYNDITENKDIIVPQNGALIAVHSNLPGLRRRVG